MDAPRDDTIERWAFEYISSAQLELKLAPPPPPERWEDAPPTRRIEAPGRPAALRKATRRMKSPRPGALARPDARADVLHRFLHHELQAAELLAWAILAFPDAPRAFRGGLLAILQDEIRHMALYRGHLATLGFAFGDLPINDWFWTRVPDARSPAQFVAVLAMGLEAGNLDHGARFQERFLEAGDPIAAEIQARVVLEEVSHVAFGLHWFQAFTGGLEFAEWRAHLVPPLTPVMMQGRPLNLKARRRAGFPETFIAELSTWMDVQP